MISPQNEQEFKSLGIDTVRRRERASVFDAGKALEAREWKNALPFTCLFGPSNRSGCLFRLGCPRTRAAGLLRSSDGHCGGARRDCRREAMQWAVGLPACPLVLSAMLDVANEPAVV